MDESMYEAVINFQATQIKSLEEWILALSTALTIYVLNYGSKAKTPTMLIHETSVPVFKLSFETKNNMTFVAVAEVDKETLEEF